MSDNDTIKINLQPTDRVWRSMTGEARTVEIVNAAGETMTFARTSAHVPKSAPVHKWDTTWQGRPVR